MYSFDPSRTAKIWPFAAVCCLGLLGFLIAATIILALIPVFVPKKEVTPTTTTANRFYLEYFVSSSNGTRSAPNTDDTVSGSVDNLADFKTALGLGDDAELMDGFAVASYERRRRSTLNRRQRRSFGMTFKFGCKPKLKSGCIGQCITTSISKLVAKIKSIDLSNKPCRIKYGDTYVNLTLSFQYVGVAITNDQPSGFSFVNSTTFVAIRNGSLSDPATWLGGVVPFSGCSVIIASGITVSYSSSKLSIPLKKIDVSGTIQLGQNTSTFTFAKPANIIIRSGGSCQDLTSSKKIFFPDKSIITVRTGGSFGSTSTVIQQSSTNGTNSSITLTSASGPFTCGILSSSAGIVKFPRVTSIVVASGDISSGSTFLGGEAPSASSCESECGLYVTPGYNLSTSSLNGVCTIPFSQVDVPLGALLQLGTPGSSDGFKFMTLVRLAVLGKIGFMGSGGGVRLPFGSAISIAIGAQLISSVGDVIFQTFNLVSNVLVDLFTFIVGILETEINISISTDGSVTNSSNSTGTNTSSTTIAPNTLFASLSTETETGSTSTSTGSTTLSATAPIMG